jgi:hypothetical protein
MKQKVNEILDTMSNDQLAAIYLSLEDDENGNYHPLKRKACRILRGRGQTIGGVRKYHSLKN